LRQKKKTQVIFAIFELACMKQRLLKSTDSTKTNQALCKNKIVKSNFYPL